MKAEKLSGAAIASFKNSYLALVRMHIHMPFVIFPI